MSELAHPSPNNGDVQKPTSQSSRETKSQQEKAKAVLNRIREANKDLEAALEAEFQKAQVERDALLGLYESLAEDLEVRHFLS